MDLAKLEADIHELERRYKQWDANLVCLIEDRLRTLEGETYTEADRKREINILYRQQLAVYNPRLAERPLLNEVIAAFPSLPADEREATRNIFAKFDHNGLFRYIIECAECLETPEDEDIFRLALIAAAIQNAAWDFRDTAMILAELAIAATKAGINMEPHCTAIVELCSEYPSKGGMFMKSSLANFHINAPKAVRLVPYDWINNVELEE